MGFFSKIWGKNKKTENQEAAEEQMPHSGMSQDDEPGDAAEASSPDTASDAEDADTLFAEEETPPVDDAEPSGHAEAAETGLPSLSDTPEPELDRQAGEQAEAVSGSEGSAPSGSDEAEADSVVTAPDTPEPENEVKGAETVAPDRESFILALRQAAPTPGNWLRVVLEGLESPDEVFWQRLELLFEALDRPEKGREFIADLQQWLEGMKFTKIDEFSSELQYRLALSLGMENDAEEKKRFLAKLWNGLARTRELISGSLRSLFSGSGELDAAFWETLEEALILSDVGYETSLDLVSRVKAAAKKSGARTPAQAKELLQRELEDALTFPPVVRTADLPEIVLMVGVNGAGKTTTIAKLAYRERLAGKKVLIAAGDTFRAAAVEQLEVWARRVGADFYSKAPSGSQPADPAAVAYEAVGRALSEKHDIVFIDTAGRLQTKAGLMEELGKIVRVLGKRHPGAPHRTILVLDATTGQNALSQARLFAETAPVSEIIISKLDGTAKAGVAVGVAAQQKTPITFIGLGEKMEDLRPFDGQSFARALLE
ncbi:MAG: signal recognition particle-docking protein FtsY [Desulfovibrionaceae bacterium]|nr:signal recognition particle-docking protein FtsY [Desulfovibrionaceae bacterium]